METLRKIYVYGSVVIDDDILNSSLRLTNFLKDTKLLFIFLNECIETQKTDVFNFI